MQTAKSLHDRHGFENTRNLHHRRDLMIFVFPCFSRFYLPEFQVENDKETGWRESSQTRQARWRGIVGCCGWSSVDPAGKGRRIGSRRMGILARVAASSTLSSNLPFMHQRFACMTSASITNDLCKRRLLMTLCTVCVCHCRVLMYKQ